jgi:hypothetical protein
MADRHWLGVDGNWNNTANWAATDGGAGGQTVPGASDDVYINRGTLPIDTNIAAPSNATVANMYIRQGFGGNTIGKVYIGDTSGNALVLAVTGVLEIDCDRAAFFRFGGAIGTLNVLSVGQGCRVLHSAGSVSAAYLGSSPGYCEFADDVELTNLDTEGCRVMIFGDATSAVALELDISPRTQVECWRRIERATVLGTLILGGAAESDSDAKILVGPGGTLDCRQSGNLAGTTTGFVKVLSGGTLTDSNGRLPFTIAKLVRGAKANVALSSRVTVSATQLVGKQSPQATPTF